MSNYMQPLAGQTMNQLNSSNVLQNAYFDSLFKMRVEVADREKAQGYIAAIAKLCDDFDAVLLSINQNGDLSAQGRASAITTKSADFIKRLDTLTAGVLTSLATQISEHQSVLNRSANGGQESTMVSELRAQETRAQFADVDPIMRPTAYLKMIAAGNVAACLAVENAPYVPLLDAQVIEEGRANRAALANPERFAGLESARNIKDLLADSIRFARKHLDLAATLDPLQIAARGM